MATTTNFGWETPDDTDLVKDGAAAIRTLGSAIDTSLVDLKGGTTGQVLSKTSNTDMDFTWVTSDDANAIQNAIVDAKGDLIAASAADTPARLAVGNNGETIVADSSTSTGLRWQPGNGLAQGAINGAFDIWQRGTTFTNPSSAGIYTADRWVVYFNGNGTVTQETSVKPDTSTYALKVTATASSADNSVYQLIEQLNMEQFRGKTVTLSVKVAGTATLTPALGLAYSTTADNSLTATNTAISASVVANPAINTSTYVTYISQFTVPNTAKTLRIQLSSGTMANTNVLYWAEAQLETGLAATTFRRAGGNIAGELAACQRYYQKSYNTDTAVPTNATGAGLNYAISGNVANNVYFAQVPFRVSMRSAPTVTIYSYTTSQTGRVSDGNGTDLAATSGVANVIGTNSFALTNASGGTITAAAGGFTFHWAASSEL